MRFSFRHKMLALAGTTGLAFLILILTGEILDRSNSRKLKEIQDRYIPLVELGPRLEAQFATLRRSFQDAVAAQDRDALRATGALKTSLVEQIRASSDVIGPAKSHELIASMDTYFTSALQVSRRLLNRETGVSLVKGMGEMQTKQTHASKLLKEATQLDRTKLTQAFTSISEDQVTNSRLRFLVSVLCTVLVMTLALWISRGVIQSVHELFQGFSRFAEGDFTQPIPITRQDELGDVASQANQMAVRIKDLIKELEAFSYTVAHDLRAPLRAILGFTDIVMSEHASAIPDEAKSTLARVTSAAKRMSQLIDSLLGLSRLSRKELVRQSTDLSQTATEILEDLKRTDPGRNVRTLIEPDLVVQGDSQLLLAALTNLLGNAWKFTSKRPVAHIEFGVMKQGKESLQVYYVKDNGAGFNMEYAGKLFGTFQRLHSAEEFEGTGIGLASVQKIIHRHGGQIWAEGEPDKGATFYFTLAG